MIGVAPATCVFLAVLISAPLAALARPLGHHGSSAAVFRVQIGRQSGVAPSRSLQLNVAPHKLSPTPSPKPEFNPLKLRRMAMPQLPAAPDFGF